MNLKRDDVNLIYNKKLNILMKDNWNIKYDWNLVNSTWTRTERLDTYWSGVTYIPDNYFKYQKCLSGITYQYVNTLDDIYVKNAMVGKTWCIYDMYNEFDIINNFMVNIDTVDICSTSNLDLTQRFYNIDNAYLKTKHKVLLVNQDNKIENDLYNVDQRGYLIKSNLLSDSGNTFRYKAYVKLGDNKHNEYHLKDVGGVFPVSGYESEYMLGKTYILKHFFTYDINSINIVPKLIFTDYDVARHMNPSNFSLYTGFTLTSPTNIGDKIVIKYHDNEYNIEIKSTETDFVYNIGAIISDSTVYNGIYVTPGGNSNQFFIKVHTNFWNNSKINDYVKITFSGKTNLEYYTYIRYKDVFQNLILQDPIPTNILEDFYINGGTYTVRNLQYSTILSIVNILNESYYAKYFDISSLFYISTKYYKYDHYFDYDGLQFFINDINVGYLNPQYFTTNNTYVKYKLYEHLSGITSVVFNNSYVFDSVISPPSLTDFTTGFTVLITDTQSSEYYNSYPKGTYIKITPDNPNDVYFFRKNTFVNLNSSYKTLIVDHVPNEYFVIETYKSNSALTITNIDTIYSLTGVSDLLYSVYKNDENDWYRERPDNIRKTICNSYSRIIENDSNITRYTTALLTQDDKNKFILELYNPESLSNNGGLLTETYDPLLTYKPIELLEIGVDKHTKIPIPILNENLLISSATGISYNTFSFKVESSISVESITFSFSYFIQNTNSINTDLNIDWGDGTSEVIPINPYHSNSSSPKIYNVGQSYTIIFSGNLQYIEYIQIDNSNVTYCDITKIKNLETLSLNTNSLSDLDISGLIYLRELYLNQNKLLNVDKFFNTLDINGLLSGKINTSGIGNSSVTNVSLDSRTNLINNKDWSLVYN